MSSDLESMIRVAARAPTQIPPPSRLWRRARARALLRGAGVLAAVAGVAAGVAAVTTTVMTAPGLHPVIDAAHRPAPPTAEDLSVERPVERPVERWSLWTVHGLGLAVQVPESWDSTNRDPLARSGPTGHVRLAVATGHAIAPELCRAEADRPGSAYGSGADITGTEVAGDLACVLTPAGGGTALAIVPVPRPPGAGGAVDRTYLFVHADVAHIDALVDSLVFLGD